MSFTRFAGLAVVLLSLGFLATALPAVTDSIPAITGTDAVSVVCGKAIVDIEACLRALLGCNTLLDVKVQVGLLVELLKACTAELLKIGVVVDVTVAAKANIVACVGAIICLLVKVLVQLTVKFGVDVIVALCVEVDVCLKALLAALEVCIPGIVVLIAAVVKVVVGLLVQIKLNLCLSALGLTL